LPDSSNFKTSYPDFQEIYQSHFQGANFDTVLRRDSDFKARKLSLVSVRHLEKIWRLRPEKRVQLVQLLLRGDFNGAQCIIQEAKRFSTLRSLVTAAFGASPSDGGPLKKEMKILAAGLSDSQFLFELKGVHDSDEVLQSMIRDIEVLSYSLLSSLIDTTVGAMAHAVAEMQQEVVKRNLQHEIESEEMKLRNEALKELIRKLNARSAGQKNLCVLYDLIKYE
jgi:hypothetical protein